MRIGIDIDNVISNFNDVLLDEFLKHDKELGNTGIVYNNDKYITRGMFNWTKEETDSFYKNNIEDIVKKLDLVSDCKKYIDKLKQAGNKIFKR